jgi:uncharacterized DUF497 family protein
VFAVASRAYKCSRASSASSASNDASASSTAPRARHKAHANLLKHRVSFDEAADVFQDPLCVTVFDAWHSVDEVRWATIGASNKLRLLVVFHTYRASTIRLISARLPTANERRQYEEEPS